MKPRLFLVAILFASIWAIPQSTVYMQSPSTVRHATTNIIQMQLGNPEPPPSGVPALLAISGGGGGGTDLGLVPTQRLEWTKTPKLTNLPPTMWAGVTATACGPNSVSAIPLDARLRFPSGRTAHVVGSLGSDIMREQGGLYNRCWVYMLTWSPGMELGDYTLTLDYPSQQLSTSWQVDYPTEPTAKLISDVPEYTIWLAKTGGWLLMRFPEKSLRIHFYSRIYETRPDGSVTTNDEGKATYMASRDILLDSDGAVAIVIAIARSSRFALPTLIRIEGYQKVDDRGKFAKILSCPNSPHSRLNVGDHVRVTPGDANKLRSSPQGDQIGRILGGEQFDIIGGPECGDSGRLYWKVNYNGESGWTAEGEGSTYWVEPLK